MAKILVVDDTRDVADVMVSLLQQSGHEVTVAYDGSDALLQLSQHVPQIVFLDIGMPTMDGFEVVRRIREVHGNRVRVVACTGYLQRLIFEKSNIAQFDAVLFKPASVDAIFKAIDGFTDK